MAELTISIPPRISDNFGEPISLLLSYIALINHSGCSAINFDFTDCKFMNPFIIAGIVSISRTEKQKGKEIKFSFNPANESINSYIRTICFPDGFDYEKHPLNNLISALEPYHAKNFIPLICFPNAHNDRDSKIREKVISAIDSIFKNQLKLKGSTLQAIYYLVSELTQNIADHSNSEKGILFAQFYPSKNYMDICIADYGKGLLQTYLDSEKYTVETDEQAVNFAVFGKSTKDLPESRGFGISTSRNMLVKGLKGKFLILSGRSFFIQTIEKEELISIPEENYYNGCYVALRIPILENEQFNFYNYVE